jgi:hypothetical protein
MFIRGDILMCTLSPIIFIAIAILFWTVKMFIGPSRVKSSRERIRSLCLPIGRTNQDDKLFINFNSVDNVDIIKLDVLFGFKFKISSLPL